MAVIGIGIDIIDHSQLTSMEGVAEGRFDHAFFRRTFSAEEYAEGCASIDSVAYFAGRFAVKEAFIKAGAALGDADPAAAAALRFECISTVSGSAGRPITMVVGNLANVLPAGLRIHSSISHEADRSAAIVLLED